MQLDILDNMDITREPYHIVNMLVVYLPIHIRLVDIFNFVYDIGPNFLLNVIVAYTLYGLQTLELRFWRLEYGFDSLLYIILY